MKALYHNYSVSIESSESHVMDTLTASPFFMNRKKKKRSYNPLSIAILDPLYLQPSGKTRVSISTTASGTGVLDTVADVEVMAFDENFSMVLTYFRFGMTSPTLLPLLAMVTLFLGVLTAPLVSAWIGGALFFFGLVMLVLWRLKVRDVVRILRRIASALDVDEAWRKMDGRTAMPME